MKLLHGNCLSLLSTIPDGTVDMVLTDPPYSSGGIFPGDRKKPTRDKYTDTDFNGVANLEASVPFLLTGEICPLWRMRCRWRGGFTEGS